MNLQLTLLRVSNGRVPNFQRTVSALGNIPALLYRALEFGTAQNREFFERLSGGERPRSHLREMIVRDQAKRFLERNDFQVDEESVDVGTEPLAALLVRCGPVQARVLKGIDGVVPGCGNSLRRRSFYGQSSNVYLNRRGETRQTRLNLLVLWDFDPTFNLNQLWLACPMRGGESSTDILLHWQEPLPYPIAAASQEETAPSLEQTAEDLERMLQQTDQQEDTGTREA